VLREGDEVALCRRSAAARAKRARLGWSADRLTGTLSWAVATAA